MDALEVSVQTTALKNQSLGISVSISGFSEN